MKGVRLSDIKAETTVLESTLARLNVEPSRSRPKRSAPAFEWDRYRISLHRDHAKSGGYEIDGLTAGQQDAVLLDAIRSSPETVLRAVDAKSDGAIEFVADGERVFRVWPKGFDALVQIHKYDVALGWITTRMAVLKEHDEHELVQRALDEVTRLYKLIVWIATTPGPKIPDALEADPFADPPVSLRSLDILELVRIAQAFIRANNVRLRYLEHLISPDSARGERGPRPAWSIFFSTASLELKVSPSHLMKDVALCEVLAQIRLAQVAREDATSKE